MNLFQKKNAYIKMSQRAYETVLSSGRTAKYFGAAGWRVPGEHGNIDSAHPEEREELRNLPPPAGFVPHPRSMRARRDTRETPQRRVEEFSDSDDEEKKESFAHHRSPQIQRQYTDVLR